MYGILLSFLFPCITNQETYEIHYYTISNNFIDSVRPDIDYIRKERIIESIYDSSVKYSINPLLVLSVMYHESNFKNVFGDSGNAVGYMQISIDTAQEMYPNLTRDELYDKLFYDVEFNVDTGVRFLRVLLDKYKIRGIAIKRYNGNGPAARKYSKKILKTFNMLYVIYSDYCP